MTTQTDKLFHCIIKHFPISDAFNAIDTLFEYGFESTSCAEDYKDKWLIEIIHTSPIDPLVVRDLLKLKSSHRVVSEILPDTDWLSKSFQNLKPITIGSFYIYGSHLKNRPIPIGKVGMEIAAATAFGTGEHPTTNRCLMAIETYLDPLQHRNFLDIGCGSCVLSIAAAKLGMRNIVACDNHDEAVHIATENTKINNVAHKIRVFQNKACEFSCHAYDFVVANILAAPLIELKKDILASLNIGGILVLSGFTTEDSSVEESYLEDGLLLIHKYNYNGWTSLVYRRLR